MGRLCAIFSRFLSKFNKFSVKTHRAAVVVLAVRERTDIPKEDGLTAVNIKYLQHR